MFMFKRIPEFLGTTRILALGVIIFGVCSVYSLTDSRDLLLTLSEKNALKKFKTQVENLLPEDFMKSDFYLIRWLRMADLDIPRAASLLLQAVEWRQANNISHIMDEDWSDLEQDYSMSFEGHDREGRPIMTIDMGSWDLRAAGVLGITRRLQRYLTYGSERNMRSILQSQKNGRHVTRALVLVDADGLNLRQHVCPSCIQVLIFWTSNMEANYPKFSDEIIIINAPSVVTFALNLIRPVMSPDTQSQLNVFGTSQEQWMAYLDKKTERKERSIRYGGTRL